MSEVVARVEAREPSARYLAAAEPAALRHLGSLATAPGGIAKLRELVLSLAVRGKLGSQDLSDKPADLLLAEIRREKSRLVAAGQLKRDKPSPAVSADEAPWPIPGNWTWVRLGELGQIVGGGTPKSDEPVMWSPPSVPWLTPADLYGLKQKYIARGRRDISEQGLALSSAQLLPSGTVLFSSRAPIGYVAISAGTLATNQGFKSCVLHLPAMAEYLYWFLKQSAKAIDAKASGTTFKEISGGEFSQVLVPLPPLAEQHRIVARVEELMKLCDALEAQGRLADEQHARLTSTLFGLLAASESPQALAENWQRIAEHFDLLLDRPEAIDALERTVIQLAVRGLLLAQEAGEHVPQVIVSKLPDDAVLLQLPDTWLWTTMEAVLSSGPSNGFSPKPSLTADGVRCLTLSATTKGYFRSECYKFIDIDSTTAAQYHLKRGDLLLQRANSLEHVGIAAIYDGDDDAYTFPDLMMRMRVSPSLVTVRYLHLWLISSDARAYLRSKATGTQGNMPKVNQAVVRQVPVPLPPLAEQRRIVARVDELRRLCAQLRERLAAARQTQTHLADALIAQAAA